MQREIQQLRMLAREYGRSDVYPLLQNVEDYYNQYKNDARKLSKMKLFLVDVRKEILFGFQPETKYFTPKSPMSDGIEMTRMGRHSTRKRSKKRL